MIMRESEKDHRFSAVHEVLGIVRAGVKRVEVMDFFTQGV
jgi:hypothetical protein